MYSEGWFDTSVTLPKVDKDKLKEDSHCLDNFIFQIVPKLSYDARKQLEKMNSISMKLELDQDADEQQKKEAEEFAKNKDLVEKRCTQEEYFNNRIKKTKFGEFVIYGQEVELIHKISGKIMTISNKANFESKGGSTLELKNNGRPDKCDFKLLPRYKYRSEGDRIFYGDYLVLYNEYTKNFIFISGTVLGKIDEHDDKPTYRPQMKFRRLATSAMYTKHVMELKQKNNSRFQLIPFCHADPDKGKFIKGGDIIRIKHTEIDGHL